MFIIYIKDLSIKLKCTDGGSYFYKNKNQRRFETDKKKKIFHLLHFKSSNFFYMHFFRKYSMFRRSIPVNEYD